MATDHIFISATPGEARIAEVADGALSGLTVHRAGAETRVGDIYLGRVEAVIHGLQAAFVDIGEARSGFLALPEVRPFGHGDEEDSIGDYLSEGDAVMVQVQRDAEEDKGAKLTTRVSLSGRDLVYTPDGASVSISRRIGNDEDRKRLQAVMAEVSASGGGGFIVRTAAAEAEDEDLAAEAARLRARWESVAVARQDAQAPASLYREIEPALRVLREHGGAELEGIVVDDADLFARLKAFTTEEMPDLVEVLRHHSGPTPLFEAEGVEEWIDAVLDPYVALPCGGSLIISETPALTAIDVNTGSADFGGRERTGTEVNKEAAGEIARQIKLRNLSGLLVVDFVSMRRRENQQAVSDAFHAALADDPAHPNLVGFTRLGLAEMTRRRQGASLQELLCGGPAVPEKSPETVALSALRGVLTEAAVNPAPGYVLEVHPSVADVLGNAHANALAETQKRLGGNLEISAIASQAAHVFEVRSVSGEAK
ncbi:MAG: Rne/Rng family ribonuclease [Rhodospirillaceae bacterium]|nr:Rne/Rng family ribonuclease [Rhodospirillaceae bacterium]